MDVKESRSENLNDNNERQIFISVCLQEKSIMDAVTDNANKTVICLPVSRLYGVCFHFLTSSVDIHFGHVRMYATPYPIFWTIFILDSEPNYIEKLLEFRWVQLRPSRS